MVSAHRMPTEMIAWGQQAHTRGLSVIIAGAGGAAHLPGMLASVTPLPVIGVPVPLKYLDGMDSLLSIVQMPGGIPVATVAIGNAKNAGILAARILGTSDPDLQQRLVDYQAVARRDRPRQGRRRTPGRRGRRAPAGVLMPTRWGVAGTGRMAEAFLDDFAHVPDAELVAVGSRTLDRAQAFAAERGGVAMTYADVVAADLDVLYIATPHPQHRDLALAAIAHGTPVLVEKAFTATLDGAREVVAAARESGVFCMEAMWTRLQPAVAAGPRAGRRRRDRRGHLGARRPRRLPALRPHPPAVRPRARRRRDPRPRGLRRSPSPSTSSARRAGHGHRVALPQRHGRQRLAAAVVRRRARRDRSPPRCRRRPACGRRSSAPAARSSSARSSTTRRSSSYAAWASRREEIDAPALGRGYSHEISHVAECLADGLHREPAGAARDTLGVQWVMQEALEQLGITPVEGTSTCPEPAPVGHAPAQGLGPAPLLLRLQPALLRAAARPGRAPGRRRRGQRLAQQVGQPLARGDPVAVLGAVLGGGDRHPPLGPAAQRPRALGVGEGGGGADVVLRAPRASRWCSPTARRGPATSRTSPPARPQARPGRRAARGRRGRGGRAYLHCGLTEGTRPTSVVPHGGRDGRSGRRRHRRRGHRARAGAAATRARAWWCWRRRTASRPTRPATTPASCTPASTTAPAPQGRAVHPRPAPAARLLRRARDRLRRVRQARRRGRPRRAGPPRPPRGDRHGQRRPRPASPRPPRQIREVEPYAAGLAALHSPATAITDYVAVAEAMAAEVDGAGGAGAARRRGRARSSAAPAGCTCTSRARTRPWWSTGWSSPPACTPTGSPAQVDGQVGPRILPFRGEYMAVAAAKQDLVRGMVYPVPDPRYPFLGVHFTRRVTGGLEVGPNAVLATRREGYRRATSRPRDLRDILRLAGFLAHGPRALAYGCRARCAARCRKRAYMAQAQRYVPDDRRRRRGPRRQRRARAGGRARRQPGRRLPDHQLRRDHLHPQRAVAGRDLQPGHRRARRRAGVGGLTPVTDRGGATRWRGRCP